MRCKCGEQSVFINNGPNLQYNYCRTCKIEVTADAPVTTRWWESNLAEGSPIVPIFGLNRNPPLGLAKISGDFEIIDIVATPTNWMVSLKFDSNGSTLQADISKDDFKSELGLSPHSSLFTGQVYYGVSLPLSKLKLSPYTGGANTMAGLSAWLPPTVAQVQPSTSSPSMGVRGDFTVVALDHCTGDMTVEQRGTRVYYRLSQVDMVLAGIDQSTVQVGQVLWGYTLPSDLLYSMDGGLHWVRP